MANSEHLDLLKQGVEVWNRWRRENPNLMPDLREANLAKGLFYGADFSSADLRGADLREADLRVASFNRPDPSGNPLRQANLSGTDLRKADLRGANLRWANLSKANLRGVDLRRANLSWADLSSADLSWGYLGAASLIGTTLEKAKLTGCSIYGISAWDVRGTPTDQSDLDITSVDEPTITVDSLEIAQFIHLLLNNEKIRDVIDTVGKKAVLILGRFTKERKVVLDALREQLRNHSYVPILFDFEKPSSRNLTETVSTLAHLARFVIADLTDAKSIPQELQRIVPDLPLLPVQPLILDSQYEHALFKDLLDYQWVLLPYRYNSLDELLASLPEKTVAPALAKAEEIEERRKAIEAEMMK